MASPLFVINDAIRLANHATSANGGNQLLHMLALAHLDIDGQVAKIIIILRQPQIGDIGIEISNGLGNCAERAGAIDRRQCTDWQTACSLSSQRIETQRSGISS